MRSARSHHTLRRILVARGLIDPVAQWEPLSGGRTNRIWRVGSGSTAIVCKLFSGAGGSPLFPNNPSDEVAALQTLKGTGLAPDYLGHIETALGTCLLYKYVESGVIQQSIAIAATCIARLHSTPVVESCIAKFDYERAEEELLSGLRQEIGADFRALRPDTPPITNANAFLHGDIVPNNIVWSANGPLLIDWQCPRIGDPVDDVAVFLSPSMQYLYGGKPLVEGLVDAFFAAYDNSEVAQRFKRFRRYYHWRMALHCAWKTRNGDDAYGPAMALELEALQRCPEPASDPTR